LKSGGLEALALGFGKVHIKLYLCTFKNDFTSLGNRGSGRRRRGRGKCHLLY
jgi:hypothetical protein